MNPLALAADIPPDDMPLWLFVVVAVALWGAVFAINIFKK